VEEQETRRYQMCRKLARTLLSRKTAKCVVAQVDISWSKEEKEKEEEKNESF
jgi:hypothetical protein